MTMAPLSKGDPTATRAAAAGSFGMSTGGEHIDRYRNTSVISSEQAVPAPVVTMVRAARTYLFSAKYSLDDAGFSCRLLDGLGDGAATLLAEWAGRRRPSVADEMPPHIVASAIEWRRLAGRSY